jgi:hypothetical protein
MVPIILSMLGVAACAFLAYVFMQFRRELLRMRKSPAEDTMLTAADIYRMEAAWKLARMSSHEVRKHAAKRKAA